MTTAASLSDVPEAIVVWVFGIVHSRGLWELATEELDMIRNEILEAEGEKSKDVKNAGDRVNNMIDAIFAFRIPANLPPPTKT